MNPQVHYPGIPCLPVNEHTVNLKAISSPFATAIFAVNLPQLACAIAGAHIEAVQRIKQRGSGAPDSSNSI